MSENTNVEQEKELETGQNIDQKQEQSVQAEEKQEQTAPTEEKEAVPAEEKQAAQAAQKKPQGKRMALCICVFACGILLGVLATVLAWKQPWNHKGAGSKKTSDVKTVSGDYDVQDCIELGKYEGITVSLAVTQDDIDTEIESLQEEYTTYEQKEGTVQDGDKIYAAFAGYVDGKKVDDTSDTDYIDIGSGEWMDGFEDAFIGAKTGKEFSFDIAIPEGTYGDDTVDGKTVTFKATVQYICGEEIVPEYNDDFVQSISDYDTVEEYNAYIKKELAAEYEADKAESSWSDVLEACKVKAYPDDLLEAAKEKTLQEYYDMADLYGVSHDEIFQSFGREDEQDFKDHDLDELAQDTVKEQLAVQAIAEREKISYTDEEYDALVEDEYSYNTDAYDSQEEYEKADREYLEETALTNAVKNWIADRAVFKTDETDDEE